MLVCGFMFLHLSTLLPAKADFGASTTSDVNITGYLGKYPDSFSLFKQILDRTGNIRFLNAWCVHLFTLLKQCITKWLAKIGAASVEAADR